jgi:hypothetical protein
MSYDKMFISVALATTGKSINKHYLAALGLWAVFAVIDVELLRSRDCMDCAD